VNSQEQFHKWTPLHVAARNGAAKVIEELLSCGANPLLQDVDEKTPILHTIEMHKKKAMKALVSKGGSEQATLPDNEGMRPLDIAPRAGKYAQYLENAVEKKYKVQYPLDHAYIFLTDPF
jgi:ankyrin repeat protein